MRRKMETRLTPLWLGDHSGAATETRPDMAYQRRQAVTRSSTASSEFGSSSPAVAAGISTDNDSRGGGPSTSLPHLLAAHAIQASAAHRDASSLSSAYGDPAISSPRRGILLAPPSTSPRQDFASSDQESIDDLNESKYGFWGLLGRKTKELLFDDHGNNPFQAARKNEYQIGDSDTPTGNQKLHKSHEAHQKTVGAPQKSSDALSSSLNYIGGTIRNAFEEGFTIVENKTAGVIHETRKLNSRRKGTEGGAPGQVSEKLGQQNFPPIQTDHETQLKASRDVANALSAKVKVLLRELKTVKADLTFSNERSSQLEEENKLLRESCEKGDTPEDEDLIRLQLETLLAEKARLASENSTYARENRFLREIVDYHQLTMQDLVYVDEGMEEVSEVFSNPATPCLSRVASEAAISAGHDTHNGPVGTLLSLSRAVSAATIVPEDHSMVHTPRAASTTIDPPRN